MRIQLIEAGDGEQIVVFPPGFEFTAEKVQLTQNDDRVTISPIAPDANPES
jgi:virulence-associated protein VagC